MELLKVYQSFADQLNISADISKVLHGVTDIKASGNEIEAALRNVLIEILPTKYKVGHGHIIDKDLNVSKQYDLLISDNIESNSILKTKDGTEIFLYETIYTIGEVKATWNLTSADSTEASIKDIQTRLQRKAVSNKALFSAGAEIQLSTPVTSNPIRNPLFCFAFAVKSDGDLKKLRPKFEDRSSWSSYPNLTVILNEGLFVLININNLKQGKLTINLYPEFVQNDPSYEWKFISCKNSARNFAFLIFCLTEHLSNTILEKPSYLSYSTSLLGIEDDQLLNLDEL